MSTIIHNDQIRILTLHENEDKSDELFRLKKGFIKEIKIK